MQFMNSLNQETNNMTPKEKAKELIRQFYSVGAIECKQSHSVCSKADGGC